MWSRQRPDLREAMGDVCHVERRNELFEAASICDVDRRDLGDPRVFGRRIWGATRGGDLAVRGNVSIVWQRGCKTKGWRRGVQDEENERLSAERRTRQAGGGTGNVT